MSATVFVGGETNRACGGGRLRNACLGGLTPVLGAKKRFFAFFVVQDQPLPLDAVPGLGFGAGERRGDGFDGDFRFDWLVDQWSGRRRECGGTSHG